MAAAAGIPLARHVDKIKGHSMTKPELEPDSRRDTELAKAIKLLQNLSDAVHNDVFGLSESSSEVHKALTDAKEFLDSRSWLRRD